MPISKRSSRKFVAGLFLLLCAGGAAGCTASSAKKTYVLAERLWSDGNYAAAVAEFDKAHAKDPKGKLGQQALYRSAMTQAYFLGQYADAIRKLSAYADANRDLPIAWDVQKLIGEILFSKMEDYERAAHHFSELLAMRPDAEEAPEFLFRAAKSAFYLAQFDRALQGFTTLATRFPKSPWGEKAAYEIGVTQFTRGGQHSGGGKASGGTDTYQEAMAAFEGFLKKYPSSPLVPEAKFGIASCLEEMDQLDAAYQGYEALLHSYPSPNVIRIKLARIKERKAHRSR